jgi:hypothetical protein
MRNLDPTLAAGLASGFIQPFYMATLQFKTSVQRVWTGVGNLVVSGQTFVGVGSLAEVGAITEGNGVEARGTTVTLSGIDPVLLGESLTDVQPGLQAIIWLGGMDRSGNILGTPYQIFSGIIDQPSVSVGADTISISLALEGKILDFHRASHRKFTSADQRAVYPHDSGFDWVEKINFVAIRWQ